MNKQTFNQTGFETIRKLVSSYAISPFAKNYLINLAPSSHLETVRTWQIETNEARKLLDTGKAVPFMALDRSDKWDNCWRYY